jgi:Replication-relaxation
MTATPKSVDPFLGVSVLNEYGHPSNATPPAPWGPCRSVVCDWQPGRAVFGLPVGISGKRGAPDSLYHRIPVTSLLCLLCCVFRPSASPSLLPMTENRSSGRSRVIRARRSPSPSAAGALAEIDQRLLGVLCAHRVVRQDQLGRLFPEIPERTLRYRTRRLHDLGLAGRSRPYREQGSAPNYHWPTRRADCLMRGEPVPRGGERKRPNPIFLAHAAALTELYVAVITNTRAAGFKRLGYQREGEARETFKDGTRERALAPDATLGLLDDQDRELWAFIEIDLGTMSHTRLRAKAELYAAYAASDAWRSRHKFVPALLFLTTTDIRARRFLNALARVLSYGPSLHKRRAFVAGAAGIVWTPRRLLTEPCLADLDGNTAGHSSRSFVPLTPRMSRRSPTGGNDGKPRKRSAGIYARSP